MNHAEIRMANNVDWSHGKEAKTAAHRSLTMRIASAVTEVVNREPVELRPEAARIVACTSRDLYAAHALPEKVCALYGSLAHAPMTSLTKARDLARAEQVFASKGMHHVSKPLAAGLRTIGLSTIADEVDGDQ